MYPAKNKTASRSNVCLFSLVGGLAVFLTRCVHIFKETLRNSYECWLTLLPALWVTNTLCKKLGRVTLRSNFSIANSLSKVRRQFLQSVPSWVSGLLENKLIPYFEICAAPKANNQLAVDAEDPNVAFIPWMQVFTTDSDQPKTLNQFVTVELSRRSPDLFTTIFGGPCWTTIKYTFFAPMHFLTFFSLKV